MRYYPPTKDEVVALLSSIRPGSVLLFDRGYPSHDLVAHLREYYNGYSVFRCPAKSTFQAVEAFVENGIQEGFIVITPSNKYLQHMTRRQRKKVRGIQLRMIRLVSPDGSVSVLLTNLFNKNNVPKEEIIDLYFRRWAIEDHYRTEKVTLEIERFHGRTGNSIRQELMAAVVMSVIARVLMVLTSRMVGEKKAEYQFKNAIMTLAAEAAVLVPDVPQRAVLIFSEILHAIARVKHYRARSHRPTQPRITKRPPNKWCSGRREKLSNA